MKNTIKYITAVIAVGVGLLASSCQLLSPTTEDTSPTSIATVQSIVAIGTQMGLAFGFKDAATRTIVANYVDVYALGIRTVTGTPTTEQLIAYLNTFIPAEVKAKYPELAAFATPLVVTGYQAGYNHFKGDVAKTYAYLNAIATGFEAGASGYITKK